MEIAQARPSRRKLLRGEELTRNAESALQHHLFTEGLKPALVLGQEEVPDPPQRHVDAESILELGPVRFAED